jgi:uncharacterized protein (TIGR02231 family)
MQLIAPIVHVTVFPDRALVQRRGSATLDAGTQSLVIGGLPASLDRDSVRASGSGPAGSRIERVDVAPEYHPTAPEEAITALQRAIEELQYQLQLLEARQQALHNQQTWLSNLGEHAARDLARGLAFNRLQPEDCGTFFTFAADQTRSLNEAELDLKRQQQQVERELQAKQRELAQLNGRRGPDRLAATVDLTLPEPGEFTLELSYVVPGASWTPQYDVRVDTERREVRLTYQGLVRQNTGEDWQHVALTLSTARPSVVTRVPELEPWYLHAYTPPPTPLPMAAPMEATPQPAMGRAPRVQPFASLAAAPATPAEAATTTVEQAGATVLFHARSFADVPADGSPHLITIAHDELPCVLDYVTAPALDPVAHLRATITNITERVLLPGRAHIFHGDSYMGVTKLEKIAPNEEFQLFVGVDDSIQVKRELREKEVDKGSILQSNIRRVTYTYRTEIHNYRQTPERITLRDRLPVPQHERIKVRVLDIRPQPDERTKLDLLTWEFVLQPDQERIFEMRFSVEHPTDLVVTNMP